MQAARVASGFAAPPARVFDVGRRRVLAYRKGSDRWIPVRDVVRGRGVERFRGLLKVATWFSLMCAFRIGYREFNVGDWITRLQPKEYLIGATGWCRTVSGLQSLLSVYLLALTVLCIVGPAFRLGGSQSIFH